MKKIFALSAIVFSAGYFLSCNENNDPTKNTSINSAASSQDSSINKPASANLSPQKVQEQINREIREGLLISNDSIRPDAAFVIAETHNAIRYLLDSNYTAAQRAIESAIGKAEVITTKTPGVGLVPTERIVTVRDLVTDMETLKQAKKDIEDLTDKGYLQAVRELVDLMISEISITTSSIPLESYPVALKSAVALAKERRMAEAALILNTALNTIVVLERAIPLPLVRAELMLATADSLIASKSNKEEEIDLLLDNADYEIRFAEELGYGKRDEEFKELYGSIKQLRKEVKSKSSEGQSMIGTLRNKLNTFKNRISPQTKK